MSTTKLVHEGKLSENSQQFVCRLIGAEASDLKEARDAKNSKVWLTSFVSMPALVILCETSWSDKYSRCGNLIAVVKTDFGITRFHLSEYRMTGASKKLREEFGSEQLREMSIDELQAAEIALNDTEFTAWWRVQNYKVSND